MQLTQVRKFNGLMLYGYTFETPIVYWSIKLYNEVSGSAMVYLVEYAHNHRFTTTHIGIEIPS